MAGSDSGPRLEHIGRQIGELKATPAFFHRYGVERQAGGAVESGIVEESLGGWAQLSETEKLARLDALDWRGVTPLERLVVIEGEIDLNRVSPSIQRLYLGELRDQVLQPLDAARLPSPSAVIDDPKAWLPDPGHGGRDDGPDRGR